MRSETDEHDVLRANPALDVLKSRECDGRIIRMKVYWIFLLGNLTVYVYISPPFFMRKYDNVKNETTDSGYIIDLIEELEKQITDFHAIVQVAPVEATYDELVECVANGTYDIVMADLAQTSNRTKLIDFSVPICDNTLRLVMRKTKTLKTILFAFVKPFHYAVWLLLTFVVYTFSAILIVIFERCDKKGKKGDVYSELPGSLIACSLYHTVGALLQRGSELQVKTFSGRFQTVIVWLMSVVFVTLFTANMVTYFTAQREDPWLQSIDDLKMCRKISCDRIGVIESSQHEEYFNNEVNEGALQNYHHLKHPQECFTKLLNEEIDVALADSSSAEWFTQRPQYCDLQVTGLPFGKTYFGAALPKEWQYKDHLDDTILQLRNKINEKLKVYFREKVCDRKDDNEFGSGLRKEQAGGLFITFVSLTVFNVLLFVLEKR
ncbi:unnamed protein product, partial [Didymodactylos carnosus]